MMRKLSKIERRKLEMRLEDTYNPVKIYQQLRVLGIEKHDARELCEFYEENFYTPLVEIYKRIKKEKRNEL